MFQRFNIGTKASVCEHETIKTASFSQPTTQNVSAGGIGGVVGGHVRSVLWAMKNAALRGRGKRRERLGLIVCRVLQLARE